MKYVAILAALGLGSAVLLVNAQGVANGKHEGFMERLRAADTNADGMLSRQEAASLPFITKHFDEIDANHDNQVTFEELRAFHEQHRGHHRGHGNLVKRLDKDGDGKISLAEAQAAPRFAQRFEQIDANKDGFVTADELEAAHQARAQAHFQRIDTDGDGRISLAEAQANAPRLAGHFAQVDTNQDGFITPEELHAAFQAHHKGHRAGQ
jgi:Ca2+-binding EF-hand superfamily protein